MKRILSTASLLVTAATAALFAYPSLAGAQMTVTDLGTLGGTWTYAYDMNNKGQVVGGSLTSSGDWHAFIWQDGAISDLGTLPGGDYSHAMLISDNGEVVGQSNHDPDGPLHLVLWKDGTIRDLGVFEDSDTYPTCTNEVGQIVGHSDFGSFIWQKGYYTSLGGLGGHTIANGINDKGQVVGAAVGSNSQSHAFIWQNGVMTILPDCATSTSYARGVNEAGLVIGLWDCFWQNGEITYLDKTGWQFIQLSAANEKGQIVGALVILMDYEHTFIWQDGVTTDLGALDGIASIAASINNFGQIVGSSSAASSSDWVHEKHPYVWLDGVMTELPKFYANKDGVGHAFEINDLGEVIGSSNGRAVIWNTREMVGITINPGNSSKKIKPGKEDVVAVAVLSSECFDATHVDPSTVVLSGTDVELDDDGNWLYTDEDVNEDGLQDRVFRIDPGKLLLTDYDTVAVLQGKTYEGDPVCGWDSVKIKNK